MSQRRLRTRFAPSPTGHLHLGHAAHMLYVWGIAHTLDAEVLLRIEDHDRQRCRPAYESSILRDMDWLGFESFKRTGEGEDPYRQSSRAERYERALSRLARNWNVYRCTCTRRQLAATVEPLPTGERPYPGTCRLAGHPASVPHSLRVQWADDASPERFQDGIQGSQCQEPRSQCGDLVLRDRLGQWTYQFSVTTDDLVQGIDFVVRGEDLLASTGRQLRLGRMLGRDRPPRYYHHPLLRDQRGRKLSKRYRAPSLRSLRSEGCRAADVLGRAAAEAGLLEAARPVTASEAGPLVAKVLNL